MRLVYHKTLSKDGIDEAWNDFVNLYAEHDPLRRLGLYSAAMIDRSSSSRPSESLNSCA